jgi:hypothetical protein
MLDQIFTFSEKLGRIQSTLDRIEAQLEDLKKQVTKLKDSPKLSSKEAQRLERGGV